MPALAIPIHDLDDSGKDFVFALDEAWFVRTFGAEGAGADGVRGDTSQGEGSVAVHAQRNGREILVHGQAHARLIAQCGRCLGEVPVDVTCDLAALYAPAESNSRRAATDDEDLDIDPDAPDREFYTGEQVVIDDLVRDYLLLELPMQPRCEGGCELPGAGSSTTDRKTAKDPSRFGEDAIDPRLMPLKKLAQREPDKE